LREALSFVYAGGNNLGNNFLLRALLGLVSVVPIILEPSWRVKGDTLSISKRALLGVSKAVQWLSKALIKTRH
jgi:hypothetical protein